MDKEHILQIRFLMILSHPCSIKEVEGRAVFVLGRNRRLLLLVVILLVLLTTKVIWVSTKAIVVIKASEWILILLLLLGTELVCSERIVVGLLLGTEAALVEASTAVTLVVASLELLSAQVLLLKVVIELLLEGVVGGSWHGRGKGHLLGCHHVRSIWIRLESLLLSWLLRLRWLVWSLQHVILVEWILLIWVGEHICVASRGVVLIRWSAKNVVEVWLLLIWWWVLGSGVSGGVEVQVKQVYHSAVVVVFVWAFLLLFLIGSKVEVELFVLNSTTGVLLGIITKVEIVKLVPANIGFWLVRSKSVSEVEVFTSFVFLGLLFLPPFSNPLFFFLLGSNLGELDGLPDFFILVDSTSACFIILSMALNLPLVCSVLSRLTWFPLRVRPTAGVLLVSRSSEVVRFKVLVGLV